MYIRSILTGGTLLLHSYAPPDGMINSSISDSDARKSGKRHDGRCWGQEVMVMVYGSFLVEVKCDEGGLA